MVLQGVRWPHSLAWVDADRVAVMIARSDSASTEEAPVYEVSVGAAAADPVGDLFPLRGHRRGTPFLHGVLQPPEYLTEITSRPLLHISWPSFADDGTATNARAIDSGEPHTIWHRLYLEASIPPSCGARVWLATTSELRPPDDDAAWHEHRFGAVPAEPSVDVPRGVWLRDASELPFFPGLLPCERRPDRAGLWMALIQRPGYRVRTLVGRYLWVRLELHGDGRSTPEVAALRTYGGRRSYVQNYLPELYHESVFGPEADAHSDASVDGGDASLRVASTGADFLERLVATFESVLTPIEDRIANSWLLTDPKGAPEEAIEWLAGWIGLGFASALPVDRRRAMLENAMELYRRRGTLRGLGLALDLATGGAVARGQIVIFEDFRLRRTFATILGANLADADDPLLPGLLISGNSFVGDTLFLGDDKSASNREFLALFNADLAVSSSEAAAIDDLFERLAHRATVLVHNEIDEQDLGLIRQIVDREAPAHVAVQVLTATERFLVGMSSLVGIDTFLGSKPTPQPVRVDVSTIGRLDLITHVPSLDPRLGESPSEQPISDLGATAPAEIGTAFTLDGSGSRAASGRRIVRYHWKRID
jgi:phage tail-like protein